MYCYKAYGLNISSEIKLPGMIEGNSDTKFDVTIKLGIVDIPELKLLVIENGDIFLYLETIGKAKISGVDQITVDPISDPEKFDDTNIIPLLLGPVLALLLHQRGFLVLHGSSVKYKDKTIAFIGSRGIGKSTTAINLYKNGYPLVNDDILAIDFDDEGLPIVYPGYPHVRLSEDSYVNEKDNMLKPIRTMVGKVFCDASNGFTPEPVYLKRIYILKKGKQTKISVFKPQENHLNLIRHSIANSVLGDEMDRAKNLIQCARLINNTDVRCLEISHSFNKLHSMVKIIQKDLKN